MTEQQHELGLVKAAPLRYAAFTSRLCWTLCFNQESKMINQLFDNFDRTEFSDDIFAILGRALTVATRFDASTKALATLHLFRLTSVTKNYLTDEEFSQLNRKIVKKYSNLNRAIESLKLSSDIESLLNQARESRNELVHEATLSFIEGFDLIDEQELSRFLDHIKSLVLNVIKGDVLISTIISINNDEPLSPYHLSHNYENQYVNWVMERFDR